ncbi:hypothetical protein SAY86_002924 [Trapa natans]|uniref:Uncharacterized protein n=1 Tax=Trapa natans TaxID=22666 RepID=A0AAN7LRS3_TRANT|nr:hypothetical protein SAY86_002924 [Trapa natans]
MLLSASIIQILHSSIPYCLCCGGLRVCLLPLQGEARPTIYLVPEQGLLSVLPYRPVSTSSILPLFSLIFDLDMLCVNCISIYIMFNCAICCTKKTSYMRGLAGLGGGLLLWPTIVEQLHIYNNVHPLESTSCPTAKTGLLGGAAFLSLDSMLMWHVTLMLASNTRDDYFDEVEGRSKGDSGDVLPGDYDMAVA